MNRKIIILTIIIVVAVAAVVMITTNKTEVPVSGTETNGNNVQNLNAGDNETAGLKEFAMESFVEFIDEKPKPQFSLKEITVKKGDIVRIKITVTSGMHDFKIDEFSVYADTKELNKEYVVEFTADKVGEFIYYCAKSGHRANGHWGTLIVTE